MSINSGAYNHAGFNAIAAYPAIVAPLADSITPLSEAVLVSIVQGSGETATDRISIAIEGDSRGSASTGNGAAYNAGGFNSAVTVSAANRWSISATATASETINPLSVESVRIVQRVDLDLSSPGGSFIRVETLGIDLELNRRGRCSFDIIYGGTAYYRPQCGHQVKIVDYDGTTVLFAGSIETTSEMLVWQPGGAHQLAIRCEAVGWEQLSDKRVVNQTYANVLASAIVDDLVTDYLAVEGITHPVTGWGPTIERLDFQYERVSDAFTQIGDASGLWWRITWDKRVEFYDPSATSSSGVTFSKTSNNWLSLQSARDRSTYRNTQYLTAVTAQTAAQVESFGGDGERKTFTLGYEVSSVSVINLNGSPQTFGVRGVDTGKQWYYEVGSKEITQDDAGTPIGSTDAIGVYYIGQYATVLKYADGAAITERQTLEGGSGIYESVITDAVSTASILAAGQYAQAVVDQYAPIGQTVTIETDVSGILPGETVTLDIADIDLTGAYFVSRVSAQDVQGKRLRYSITCHSSAPDEVWRKPFQRPANKGIIDVPLTNYP